MNECFIETLNYQKFQDLSRDLIESRVGIDLACVIGRAGRGKTTCISRFTAINHNSVKIDCYPKMSETQLLQEVSFALNGVRPRTKNKCLEAIENALSERSRLILVYEADSLSMSNINFLRYIHDRCNAPIILIGEDVLLSKINRESRIASRSRTTLRFEPVSQADVRQFYKKALDLTIEKDDCKVLTRHSQGDFRNVKKDAIKVERLMRVNGLNSINKKVISRVLEG